MGSKIRVLHIIPGFGGGISSHVRNIINGINKDEVTIDVAGFTPYPDEFIAEVNNKGGKTFTLDNVRIHNLGKCIKQFREIVISGNYDAIHMHLADVQAVYFSILASTCGIKRKIVHAHIADQQGSEKALFKIRKKINQILTVSSATDLASCSKLSSEFRFGKKYVDENRVMHIPNSINATNYFEKITEDEIAKYREEFKIKEGQLIIGHVGFFGYQKNHPFMFKIARRLKERGVDFVWLFIGTGYNFDEYVHLAEIMGLGDCVRFLGRRNDVCALYKIMNDIPYDRDIGPGLLIFHIGGVVFSPKSCGKNVTISQNTTVGMTVHEGIKEFPILGDNVYLAPGSAVIGGVKVGNNVAIGTNAVLTKSAPDNSVIVGIPGKVISYNGAQEYINNPYE